MKLFIQTLGCQMNVADSAEMQRHLLQKGFTHVGKKEDADVVVLNTCTVRQHAEDKALSFIGRMKPWKKKDPSRVLIVAGCAAERLKDTLKKRFPHIDMVVGAKSIDQFPDLVDSYLRGDARARLQNALKQAPEPKAFNWFNESEEAFGAGDLRPTGAPFVMGKAGECAFVTVMRGCNYSCTYCVVPSVRGREIYRSPTVILDEVKKRASEGYHEVMLLGQTVNSFWYKERMSNATTRLVDFSMLLTQVAAVEGIHRIRFMSPHPFYMSDKLIETLASSEKFSSEIHMPVQSGSDRILRLMKRNYTRQEYAATARKLRKAMPHVKLSTDFIVGFPTETEKEFQETLALAGELDFSMAFCFKYSVRKGTEAAALADDVPAGVKEERLARLLEKTEKKKKAR